MLLEIYSIISIFAIAHQFLTVYLAGSILSMGITYSLMSYKYLNPPNRIRIFFTAAISSWIIVIIFLYGFFSSIFKNNEEE